MGNSKIVSLEVDTVALAIHQALREHKDINIGFPSEIPLENGDIMVAMECLACDKPVTILVKPSANQQKAAKTK